MHTLQARKLEGFVKQMAEVWKNLNESMAFWSIFTV